MGTPREIGIISGGFLDTTVQRLGEVAEALRLFVENDLKLRRTQAENSPIASGFQQGTIADTAVTRFDAAQSGAQKFSYIEVLIEDTAGSCRYTLDTSDPSAAGRGHKVPAGGSTLTIPGSENVKNFKIIAETGNTAAFTMQGFL
jgi:hypothetical protein